MRSDIAKVVFEKAKGGRTWASKTPRPAAVSLDHAGEQFDERSNDVHRKRQKHRNHNTGPLDHFLALRLGRPWDVVWSEVCAAPRSSLGREFRKLIDGLVTREYWIEGRTLMTRSCWGEPIKLRGFYVHARSGLLRRASEDR